MGLSCEMNLLKPADGHFTPGGTISGAFKYTLHEDQIFDKIIISLKGHGVLSMRTRQRKNNFTYTNYKKYVDMDYVIHNNVNKSPLPKGTYETQFSFTLPPNVPSSFERIKIIPSCIIKCKIWYYIRIKFQIPDFLKFDKRFKKELSVVSRITPTLPTVPTIYGAKRTMTILPRLFTRKECFIKIKATIQNSVLQPGGQIDINYEILNNADIVIRGVDTKLVEICRFASKSGFVVHAVEDIPNTETKTGCIQCGDMQKMNIAINAPVDQHSLEHSQMVSRQYCVVIKALLSYPHYDIVLEIPVQVDKEIDVGMLAASVDDWHDTPPSYWEAVAEETKKKSGDSNYDDDEGDSNDRKFEENLSKN